VKTFIPLSRGWSTEVFVMDSAFQIAGMKLKKS